MDPHGAGAVRRSRPTGPPSNPSASDAMTLTRPALLAAPVAFVATLAVLVLLMGAGRGGAPAAGAGLRALPDAPSAAASTDERIRILQATVRTAPRAADGHVLLAGAYAQKVRETGDASF